MDAAREELIDGKYRLIRTLGRGGMGTVHEGVNTRIGRRVAIKILHARLAEDAQQAQRFEKEARAATLAGSPHIVEVLDLGELPAGDRFMVMEYLEGETLGARLKRLGPDAPGDIVRIALELLAGLDAAHAAGVVHRDLKPDNVFLATTAGGGETVKIVDFGVSKLGDIGDATRATETGTLLGTPRYMAPEQIRDSRSVDARADLYAVGVLLYRALSGRHAHEADNYHELMYKIANEAPSPLAAACAGIDPELGRIVDKALARDREARFQSASELAEALTRWQRHPTTTAQPRGPGRSRAIAVVIGLCALGLALWLWRAPREAETQPGSAVPATSPEPHGGSDDRTPHAPNPTAAPSPAPPSEPVALPTSIATPRAPLRSAPGALGQAERLPTAPSVAPTGTAGGRTYRKTL